MGAVVVGAGWSGVVCLCVFVAVCARARVCVGVLCVGEGVG